MKKLGGLDASFLCCNAPYEIHHHERLARSVSLSEAAIAAAKAGRTAAHSRLKSAHSRARGRDDKFFAKLSTLKS